MEWRTPRLVHDADPGREHRVVEVAELVDARAHRDAELFREELLLEVGAELVAVFGIRGQGDVEVVAAVVAAVAQDVLAPDDVGVAELDVVGLGGEVQGHRLPGVGVGQQQVRGLDVGEVAEDAELHGVARPLHLAVGQVGRALDLEGPDARVHDSGRARVAALVGDAAAAAAGAELLVEAGVHLGLGGPVVGEAPAALLIGRIERSAHRDAARHRLARRVAAGDGPQGMAVEGNPAHRTRERVGVEVAGGEAPGQLLARGLGVREVRAVQIAAAVVLARALAPVEEAALQVEVEALRVSRALGDDVDHPRQGVGAPDRRGRAAHHFDLLDLGSALGHEVPQHETEEVEVDRAPVEHHELRGGEGGGALAARHVDVASRGLDDVEAGGGAKEVAVVLGGRGRDGVGAHDAHGGGSVDEGRLGLGSGDDDHLFPEALLDLLLGRLLCGLLTGFLGGVLGEGRDRGPEGKKGEGQGEALHDVLLRYSSLRPRAVRTGTASAWRRGQQGMNGHERHYWMP